MIEQVREQHHVWLRVGRSSHLYSAGLLCLFRLLCSEVQHAPRHRGHGEKKYELQLCTGLNRYTTSLTLEHEIKPAFETAKGGVCYSGEGHDAGNTTQTMPEVSRFAQLILFSMFLAASKTPLYT